MKKIYFLGLILILISAAGFSCNWTARSNSELLENQSNKQTSDITEHRELLKIAANHLGSQTAGDVNLEITRIYCEDRSTSLARLGVSEGDLSVVHGDAATLCILFLTVDNNAESYRAVYPEYGTVIVEDQEINLRGVPVPVTNLTPIREPIPPDSQHIMGFWVGIPEVSLGEISSIQYRLSAPLDENGNIIGNDYFFDIEVSNWNYAPLPEELLPFLGDLRVDL